MRRGLDAVGERANKRGSCCGEERKKRKKTYLYNEVAWLQRHVESTFLRSVLVRSIPHRSRPLPAQDIHGLFYGVFMG